MRVHWRQRLELVLFQRKRHNLMIGFEKHDARVSNKFRGPDKPVWRGIDCIQYSTIGFNNVELVANLLAGVAA